jgi:adenylate kinase
MPQTAILLLGPPGSGKGTQAAYLSVERSVPAISSGEMLRREIASGSELGKVVEGVLVSGGLVDDETVGRVVANRLRQTDCDNGFILDGYPRTESQARGLDQLLASFPCDEPFIFDFQISPAKIVSRLAHRLECPTCGRTFRQQGELRAVCEHDGTPLIRRPDDNVASVNERLRVYSVHAAALGRYYKNRNYYRIDADRPPEVIFQELKQIMAGAPRCLRPAPLRPVMAARWGAVL